MQLWLVLAPEIAFFKLQSGAILSHVTDALASTTPDDKTKRIPHIPARRRVIPILASRPRRHGKKCLHCTYSSIRKSGENYHPFGHAFLPGRWVKFAVYRREEELFSAESCRLKGRKRMMCSRKLSRHKPSQKPPKNWKQIVARTYSRENGIRLNRSPRKGYPQAINSQESFFRLVLSASPLAIKSFGCDIPKPMLKFKVRDCESVRRRHTASSYAAVRLPGGFHLG